MQAMRRPESSCCASAELPAFAVAAADSSRLGAAIGLQLCLLACSTDGFEQTFGHFAGRWLVAGRKGALSNCDGLLVTVEVSDTRWANAQMPLEVNAGFARKRAVEIIRDEIDQFVAGDVVILSHGEFLIIREANGGLRTRGNTLLRSFQTPLRPGSGEDRLLMPPRRGACRGFRLLF